MGVVGVQWFLGVGVVWVGVWVRRICISVGWCGCGWVHCDVGVLDDIQHDWKCVPVTRDKYL